MAVLTPKRNFISGDTPTPDHFNYASGLIQSSPTMSGTAAAGDCVTDVAGTWTEAQAGVAIYDGTNVIGSGEICVLTGLTAHARYYAQSDGAIGTTASYYPVGIALTTTQLYVSIPYINPSIIGAANAPAGVLSAEEAYLPINAQTTDYTVLSSDNGKDVWITSASNLTLTIPTQAVGGFAAKTWFLVTRGDAGTVTIAGSGGVTIVSAGSRLKVAERYGSLLITKTSDNNWIVRGATVS